MTKFNNVFKSIDNMTLLNIITLFLAIAIFVSILFGCTYKKRFERFEDKDSEKETEKESEKFEDTDSIKLSKKDEELLKGLKNGDIDQAKLDSLIEEKFIDKETVEKLIGFVSKQLDNKKSA
jgi:hypothetical protein